MTIVKTISLLIVFGTSAWAMERPALMIIDMQPRFVNARGQQNDPQNVAQLAHVIARQRTLIRGAKARLWPIYIIEKIESNLFLDETFQILREEVGAYERSAIFRKRYASSFHPEHGAAGLPERLKADGISTLILVGLNGGSCVLRTAFGALRAGYSAIADAEGIIDCNQNEFRHPYFYSTLELEREARWEHEYPPFEKFAQFDRNHTFGTISIECAIFLAGDP